MDNIYHGFNKKSLFITGGTGFFGKNLLAAFQKARQSGLSFEIGVLSRDPASFQKQYPSLSKDITFQSGDITDFTFPNEKYDYIIHAATQASVQLNVEQPWLMLNTIIDGTKRVLEFAKVCGAKRILHTSSGAVYGEQPAHIDNISEDCHWSPATNNPLSAYGEGKRVAELMGTIFAKETGIAVINARCFAFVGPYLPLDTHFAIGNFILNGLRGEDIIIKGDGTPRRSYMHTDDLVDWLLTILINGKSCEAYNVGSDISYSIRELAEIVVQQFPKSQVKILGIPDLEKPAKRYVPSIEKAKNDLGLSIKTTLECMDFKALASCF